MNYRRISKLLLTGTIMAALFAMGVFAVSAAHAGGTADTEISRKFNDVQKYVVGIKPHLDKVNGLNSIMTKEIDNLRSKGRDTTTYEAALADLKVEVSKMTVVYESAKKIVDAHAGFDDSGNVIDRDTAIETLTNARKGLSERHAAFQKATQSFILIMEGMPEK